MREHVVLSVVDPLLAASSTLQPEHGGDDRDSLVEGATHLNDVGGCDTLEEQEQDHEKDLTLMVECRICQEDDIIQNLDIPCGCNGTLKFAHRECVQLWCYEKGDTICEICHQPFKPDYSATTTVYHPGDTSIDIRLNYHYLLYVLRLVLYLKICFCILGSDDWESSSIPLDLHNSRLLAIAAVEHQVPEIREGYANAAGTNGITLWHSVGLILMALLLLKYVAPLFNADVEKVLTYFYFFFLRTAAVVLPWYLMAWIIRVIQHQRQRQQAPEELAFMLQADEQG
ncbi:hypothetical protein VIGAN_02256200 [Vigna angularis var. angularis]|uniref:RING-CH-type domain-containing protein n=1 Tax=Vigna angularis var. angularis TaxID=157739 RepID=A0A0S3RGN5_PHAAN|nr:hypothetical protein VIGAN_02256200 [Vigna angularis var. angularis]